MLLWTESNAYPACANAALCCKLACVCSGDAGVGLNVRRLTKQFTSTFTTSYSLRPVGDVGSVYRRYPGQWQVFVEDPSMEPGRYLLAAERPSRPAGVTDNGHCLLAGAWSSSFVHKAFGTLTSHNACILVRLSKRLPWLQALHKHFSVSHSVTVWTDLLEMSGNVMWEAVQDMTCRWTCVGRFCCALPSS